MTNQRTGGMLAVGILNIILGAIGTLLCLLIVVGGGFLSAGGAAFESEAAGTDAAGAGMLAAGFGGLIMIIGLVGALMWGLMAIGGIGTIMVANWGRLMCIVGGSVIGVLGLLSMFNGGFGIVPALVTGYCFLQAGLFFTADWKDAFTGTGMETGGVMESAAPSAGVPGLPGMPPAAGNNANDEFNQAA